jgi:hypothetical protein
MLFNIINKAIKRPGRKLNVYCQMKEANQKGDIGYHSDHMTFWERRHSVYGEGKKISGARSQGKKGMNSRALKTLGR